MIDVEKDNIEEMSLGDFTKLMETVLVDCVVHAGLTDGEVIAINHFLYSDNNSAKALSLRKHYTEQRASKVMADAKLKVHLSFMERYGVYSSRIDTLYRILRCLLMVVKQRSVDN